MMAWGPVELDVDARVMLWSGARLPLSKAEALILACLIGASGGYVSRDALAAAVECDPEVVRVKLTKWRHKWPEFGNLDALFEGRRGFGYRLLAEGERRVRRAPLPPGKRAAAAAPAMAARAREADDTLRADAPLGKCGWTAGASTLSAAELPARPDQDPRRQLHVALPEDLSKTLRAAAAVDRTGRAPAGLAADLVAEALDARYAGARPPAPLLFAELSVDLSADLARQAAAAGMPLANFVREVAARGLASWREAVRMGEVAA